MDDVTNIKVRLDEINLVQEFLANRKSEIEGEIAEFEKASNRFLETPNVTKADKRLAAFFSTLGYVVLNANGSADNSASGKKEGLARHRFPNNCQKSFCSGARHAESLRGTAPKRSSRMAHR